MVSRTIAGIVSSPASWLARHRRSPMTSWYCSGPIRRTTIGCMRPNSRIECTSSPSASSSKTLRGCLGLGWICSGGSRGTPPGGGEGLAVGTDGGRRRGRGGHHVVGRRRLRRGLRRRLRGALAGAFLAGFDAFAGASVSAAVSAAVSTAAASVVGAEVPMMTSAAAVPRPGRRPRARWGSVRPARVRGRPCVSAPSHCS